MMNEKNTNTSAYSVERCFIGERTAAEIVAALIKVHSR